MLSQLILATLGWGQWPSVEAHAGIIGAIPLGMVDIIEDYSVGGVMGNKSLRVTIGENLPAEFGYALRRPWEYIPVSRPTQEILPVAGAGQHDSEPRNDGSRHSPDNGRVLNNPGPDIRKNRQDNPLVGLGVIFVMLLIGGYIIWRADRWVKRKRY